jgi:uncharacterized protein YprB with RNaseH-like and TPR domain
MATELVAKLRQWGAAGPLHPRLHPPGRIETVVPGRFEPTPYGPCFVAETCYPVTTVQGTVPLAAALALAPTARRILARQAPLELVDAARALFIDTETTGLAGGTGTYVFLVGLGYFDGPVLRIRQYFMRHPGEEAALLAAVGAHLARHPLWVTFNGKAFDVPLLETRYRCWRRQPAPQPALHLDLLPWARRLWRRRLPSCALASLERHLLGVQRWDDVPSWAIPALYFDYVRRGRAAPLRAVFAHNTYDLLSLVALLGVVGQVLAQPAPHLARVDATALVRLYAEAGLAAAAASWCTAGLEQVPPAERGAFCRVLAHALRRDGHHEAAAQLWQRLAGERGPWRLTAYIELAKYYEAQRRDYPAAIRALEAALALLAVARTPLPDDRQRHQLERRLGRLHARLYQRARL